MKRFKTRKKYQISKVVLMDIALIFFFTCALYNIYSNKYSDKVINVASIKLNEFMEYFLSNNISYDIFSNNVLDDIITINKNNDDEILYVSYNLDKTYYVLDIVTKTLENNIASLENGEKINVKNVVGYNNGIVLKIPMFMTSKNFIISNIGPRIYIPINFASSILTNLKTKITDYGINNALVEMYVTIKLRTNIIGPFYSKDDLIEYDSLVASVVINGRIPSVYGGLIQSESSSYKAK